MTVRHQYLHISKERRDPDAAVGFSRAPDFAGIGALVVRNHFAMREPHEGIHKIVGLIARYVDPVVRNGFERRICGWREVPIQLHLDTARPLNDGVNPDRILEWLDNYFCSRRSRSLD